MNRVEVRFEVRIEVGVEVRVRVRVRPMELLLLHESGPRLGPTARRSRLGPRRWYPARMGC